MTDLHRDDIRAFYLSCARQKKRERRQQRAVRFLVILGTAGIFAALLKITL